MGRAAQVVAVAPAPKGRGRAGDRNGWLGTFPDTSRRGDARPLRTAVSREHGRARRVNGNGVEEVSGQMKARSLARPQAGRPFVVRRRRKMLQPPLSGTLRPLWVEGGALGHFRLRYKPRPLLLLWLKESGSPPTH